MEKIGFVGVGRMGANMARRLREVGYPVVAVYDVYREAARSLAQESGCEACSTLARVTALSDVVITVVTDDTAMRRIYADKKDNLLRNAAGKVFINCATITPRVHTEAEELAGKAVSARTLPLRIIHAADNMRPPSVCPTERYRSSSSIRS